MSGHYPTFIALIDGTAYVMGGPVSMGRYDDEMPLPPPTWRTVTVCGHPKLAWSKTDPKQAACAHCGVSARALGAEVAG